MIKVPLKKNTPVVVKKGIPKTVNGVQISAYDIILGNVEIDTEQIPAYLDILTDYEKECAEDGRYIEAEMAKHKKEEMKKIVIKVKKEKTQNAHLKEKVEIEEAYLNEFNDFQNKWNKKLEKFEGKVEESRKDMLAHQKNQLEEAVALLEERSAMKAKDNNKVILEMQLVEKTLAKQRNYIEAQKTKESWQKEKESLAIKQKQNLENKKNELLSEYEIRNKREIEEFVERINDMRISLENERQRELDSLCLKYDKVKTQLKTVQESEAKRIESNIGYRSRDLNETHLNTTESFVKIERNENQLDTKRKLIMKKINRLNGANA